jgi:hypothetical protein
MENEEKTFVKIQKIIDVMVEAYQLNNWSESNFRGALSWMICGSCQRHGMTIDQLNDFMQLTWKLYEVNKLEFENE